MVARLEDKVVPRPIDEALSKVLDGSLKLVGHEHLVREGREGEVEVVRQIGVGERVRLRRSVKGVQIQRRVKGEQQEDLH